MAKFCGKCGTTLDDSIMFCTSCGTEVTAPPAAVPQTPPIAPPDQPVQMPYQQAPPPYQQAPPPYQQGAPYQQGPQVPQSDEQQNKWSAMAAYLLFCVPLFTAPNSRFGRFHANQGLILNILMVLVGALHGIFSAVLKQTVTNYWYIYQRTHPIVHVIFGILWLGTVGLMALGMMNASKGTYKQLPVIGKFTLLK